VEEIIRVDLSLDVREYARRIKSPALLITAMHDQIVATSLLGKENLIRRKDHLKSIRAN